MSITTQIKYAYGKKKVMMKTRTQAGYLRYGRRQKWDEDKKAAVLKDSAKAAKQRRTLLANQ